MRRNEAGQVVVLPGPLLAIADGEAQTSGAAATWVADGTSGAAAGTLTHITDGVWKYAPTQGETDCEHWAVIVTKSGSAAVVLSGTTTRFPSQTAGVLPAAAADGPGGLPISDAGGLDLDAVAAAIGTPVDLNGGATLADNLVDVWNRAGSISNDLQDVASDAAIAASNDHRLFGGPIGDTGNTDSTLHLPGLSMLWEHHDDLRDYLIRIRDTSNTVYFPTGVPYSRWITGWNKDTEIVTLHEPLPFTPEDEADIYELFSIRRDVTADVLKWKGESPDELVSGRVVADIGGIDGSDDDIEKFADWVSAIDSDANTAPVNVTHWSGEVAQINSDNVPIVAAWTYYDAGDDSYRSFPSDFHDLVEDVSDLGGLILAMNTSFRAIVTDDEEPAAGQFTVDGLTHVPSGAFNGRWRVVFVSGPLMGQSRILTMLSHNNDYSILTFDEPFSEPPQADDEFVVEAVNVNVDAWKGETPNALDDGLVQADMRAIAGAPTAVDTGTEGVVSFLTNAYVATAGDTVSANVVQIDGEPVQSDSGGKLIVYAERYYDDGEDSYEYFTSLGGGDDTLIFSGTVLAGNTGWVTVDEPPAQLATANYLEGCLLRITYANGRQQVRWIRSHFISSGDAGFNPDTDFTAAPQAGDTIEIFAARWTSNVAYWRGNQPGNVDSNGYLPANLAAVNGNTTRAATLATWTDNNRLDVSVSTRAAPEDVVAAVPRWIVGEGPPVDEGGGEVEVEITAANWGGGGYGTGYINDEIDVAEAGSIDPDPALLNGEYRIRRLSTIENGSAFSIVIQWNAGEGDHEPDELWQTLHVVGGDVDVTLSAAEADYFAHAYNGSYSAWNFNGGPALQNSQTYTITFTLGGGTPTGSDGDWYEDAATGNVYGPRVDGVWGEPVGRRSLGVRYAVGLAEPDLDEQLAAIGSPLQSGDYTAPLNAAGIRTAVGLDSANLDTQLTAIKADTAATLLDTGTDGVIVAASSKSGYSLASTGLDAIAAPEPSAKPNTFVGWLMWLVQRFRRAEMTSNTLTVKTEAGSTVTTQTVSNVAGTQSVGPPS